MGKAVDSIDSIGIHKLEDFISDHKKENIKDNKQGLGERFTEFLGKNW